MSVETVFTPEEVRAIAEKSTKWNLNALRVGFFLPLILEIVWRTSHDYPQWISMTGTAPTWWIAVYSLLLGYLIFCWTSAFHETVHQTLSSHNGFNRHLGRVIGTVVLLPYTAYRETHIRHHAYLNRSNDWELWPYSSSERSIWFRRVFVWFDLLMGLPAASWIYGRIYFHRDSPLSVESRRLIRNEYLAALAAWAVMASWLTYSHNWGNLLQVWIYPAMVAGTLQTARKLTEHLGMSSFDPLLGTRTVKGPSWITKMASFMNFDIFVHGPHHRHPRVVHTALGELMDEYLESNPQRTFPVYRTYLHATTAMVPWMVRNPGVGANIAETTAAAFRANDVHDFVQDVSQEVLPDSDVSIC